jgi:enoyl-CoA hydratase/carnithine racemase
MSDLLQIDQHDRVLRIALNRPEKRNALSSDLCRELVDALNNANRDSSVGAIVLAGNGPVFSAGMDLQEVRHLSPQSLSNVHEQLFTVGSRLGKPLVGAVNGSAFGGGLGLVANCHVVIAQKEAKFGLTEIRLGLWPFLVFQAVTAALGERRAVELAITGRIFDAAEAKTLALVHELVDDANARAMECAQAISEFSPTAIRSGLSFVSEARGQDPARGIETARRIREELMATPDFQEGIRAFLEKRQPVWPSVGTQKKHLGDPTP